MLTQMGLERKLPLWNAPDSTLRELKALTRERSQFQKEKTKALNQLHAYKSAFKTDKKIISRTKKKITFFEKMILEVEQKMDDLVKCNEELAEKVERIVTIPGIRQVSALTVIAETNGFALINNAKQLVSYAGLDVVQKQSGTSINKKTRISKKGNSHLRRALYMPALSASKRKYFKLFYERVNEAKPYKKIGVISVEQKLLKLIYSLWKSGQKFDSTMSGEILTNGQSTMTKKEKELHSEALQTAVA
ncbi:MAG: transposase [Reichenbachiella sp.]